LNKNLLFTSKERKTKISHLNIHPVNLFDGVFYFEFCINFVITNSKIMEVSVIKIGNSKGIRLSKTLLEKYKIKDTVNLILEDEHIIIKPGSKPREGWEKAFKKMADNGDDKSLIDDFFEDETFEGWK
jgi:antitoxin MazE